MEDFKRRFLSHLSLMKGASAHTLRAYEIDLASFFTFLDGEPASKKSIRRYLSHLYEQKLSNKTILRKISSLRSFYKHAKREKWVEENPLDEIESPKKEKRLPIHITYAQVEHLLAQPDTSTLFGLRDRAIMELFYSSGLRLSELANLNLKDFFDNELNIFGKGKKQRKTPITHTAADWIQRYLAHPERDSQDPSAIFLNHRGKRLTPRSIDRNFARYLRLSGLSERITPHTIRHTIATHWLENGMDLKIHANPRVHSAELGSLPNGTNVYVCDETETWLQIFYSAAGKPCKSGTPDGLPEPQRRDCRSGWVQKKWINVISG